MSIRTSDSFLSFLNRTFLNRICHHRMIQPASGCHRSTCAGMIANLVIASLAIISMGAKEAAHATPVFRGTLVLQQQNTPDSGSSQTSGQGSDQGNTASLSYGNGSYSIPDGLLGVLAAPSSTVGTPAAFSLISGSLPPGMSLSSATGVIAGRPTAAGTYSATIKASGPDGTAEAIVDITID